MKYIATVFLILISLNSFAEQGRGGGDPCEGDFKMHGQVGYTFLKAHLVEFDRLIDAESYHDFINRVNVGCSEKYLSAMKMQKSAYTDGKTLTTILYLPRWDSFDDIDKNFTALHEGLVGIGVESTGFYPISLKYLEQYGRLNPEELDALPCAKAQRDIHGHEFPIDLYSVSLLTAENRNTIGFQCRSSRGYVFERVKNNALGEAWKDPWRLIWGPESDVLMNFYNATKTCQAKGARLPTKEELEQGEVFGIRELPRKNWEGRSSMTLWSSTSVFFYRVPYTPQYDFFGAYTFYRGSLGPESKKREVFSFRCVVDGETK